MASEELKSVIEMAEAHLMNVQNEIKKLESSKLEIDKKIDDYKNYLTRSVSEVKIVRDELQPINTPMPEQIMVTDSEVAYFIAMFIVFVVACSFSIGWAKADGIKPISDKFELGYIEEDGLPISPVEVQVVDEYDELKDLERQVKIAKLKKQLHDINNPKRQ